MDIDKTRERRVRRMAERQGLRLVKSRRRDPLAKDYGLYMVADPGLEDASGVWPAGQYPAHKFPWDWQELDFVEQFLSTRPEDR